MREFIKKNPPRFAFWVGLLVILVFIGIGVCFSLRSNRDVLVKVGSKAITTTDLRKAIYGLQFNGTELNPDTQVSEGEKQMILNSLIEEEIARQEATKLDISVSDSEIDEFIAAELPSYNTYTQAQKDQTRESVRSTLLIEKVRDAIVGWKEGKVAVLRFDRAYYNGTANPETVAAEEQKYAEGVANSIYTDLLAGTITMDQAMAKADADPKIGKATWGGAFGFSFILDKTDYESHSTFDSSPDMWNQITGMAKGISEPKIAKIIIEDPDKEANGFYFITEITNEKSGSASYDSWLTEKLKEYGVTK